MDIRFKSNKLKKACEDPRVAQKEFGKGMGSRLLQRVIELDRAKSLKDISKIPAARLHRLEGSRSDEYAVDLAHPFRLVLKPILDDDGDINKLELIKIISVEEVTDYHGKQKRK